MPALTAAALTKRLRKMGLSKFNDRIAGSGRSAVQIITAKGRGGFSQLGGKPTVPAGFKWPKRGRRPLAFLAQIDLARASKRDRTGLLPTSGRLWFFYDTNESPWGFDPADREGWNVIYSDEPAAVKPMTPPRGTGVDGDAFPRRAIDFKAVETFPGVESLKLDKKEIAAHFEALYELTRETINADQGAKDRSAFHRMLGHATVVQNPMEIECQLVSNGIYAGDGDLAAADKRRAAKLAKGADDWVLLLQLDSDDSLWMWGDMGLLFFWIRKQDLAKRDFSKVWVILQCG